MPHLKVKYIKFNCSKYVVIKRTKSLYNLYIKFSAFHEKKIQETSRRIQKRKRNKQCGPQNCY